MIILINSQPTSPPVLLSLGQQNNFNKKKEKKLWTAKEKEVGKRKVKVFQPGLQFSLSFPFFPSKSIWPLIHVFSCHQGDASSAKSLLSLSLALKHFPLFCTYASIHCFDIKLFQPLILLPYNSIFKSLLLTPMLFSPQSC